MSISRFHADARTRARAAAAALVVALSALSLPTLAQSQSTRVDSSAPRPRTAEPVYSIALGPLRAGAYVGSTVTLPASASRDGVADASATSALSWETSDPRTAWVSPTGQVTFLRPGHVTVTASYRSTHSSMALDVKEGKAQRVDLAQGDIPRISVGDTVRFAARVVGDAEQPIADAPVSYALVTRGIVRMPAQLSDDGAFVAREPGLYTVVASFGGVGAAATVNVGPTAAAVTAPGDADKPHKLSLDVPAYDMFAGTTVPLSVASSGNTDDGSAGQPLRWSSSDTSIAWVDQQGTVRFRSSGRVKITAANGTASGTRGFTVAPNPVRRMVFNAPLGDLHVGDEMKLKTYVWGRGGYALNHMRVNYAVRAHPNADGSIPRAMITEDGLFMPEQPGTYTLIAESGGVAEQMTVFVAAK